MISYRCKVEKKQKTKNKKGYDMKICDALKTKPIRIPLKKIFPTENIQKLDALNLFVLKWNKKRTCDEASCRAILADFDTYVVEEEHKNYIKNLTSNKCQELTALYEGRILCVAATISLLIKKLKGNGNTRYIDFNYSDFCRQTNTKSSLKEYLRYMLIRMPLIDPQYLLLTPIPEIAKYIQIAIDILPYIPVGDKIINNLLTN